MTPATALVTNPVLIFFIVLAIILMAPLLLNRLKIPHIIGMIVAGVCVGPFGFHVLDNDASFSIFGQVGLLYLMFLAGIEIDLFHLRLNLKRGLVFGLLTFFIPLLLGIAASVWLLHLDAVTSVLLASMYASHTLIAYPVTARFGITKSPAVLISVVGTIVAVIGALLSLAIALNVQRTGQFSILAIALLLAKLIIYCGAVLSIYPLLTRSFLRRYNDRVTQFVYVLALVFLAAYVAQAIGLEAALGAFLAGLVLNRFVPNTSPLMSRIEFVGNALFIPYFLIGVGMMIDVRVIAQKDTLIMAANMLAVALSAKWIAAWLTQKFYRMTPDDRGVMFGLSTAHTAVALAVVTIGYNFGLMNIAMLNGTVLMILLTCALAPMITSRSAAGIKLHMLERNDSTAVAANPTVENTLVPVSSPVTALELMELALMIHPRGPANNIYTVNIRNDNTAIARSEGHDALQMALNAAATVDIPVIPIERFDLNTATGLINTINERDITSVIMGLHRKVSIIDTFFGAKMEQLLKSTNRQILISRCFNPVNTLRRLVVWVPPKAEYETGFPRWVASVGRLAGSLGSRLIFLCHPDVRRLISGVLHHERLEVRSEFHDMEQWDDFLLVANRILDDDLLIVISARPGSMSYSPDVQEMPSFLRKYFALTNLIVIFPEQFGRDTDKMSFVDPIGTEADITPSIFWRLVNYLNNTGRRMRHRRRPPRIPPDL